MGYTCDWRKTRLINPNFKCPSCGGKEILYREWESSCGGYDDYHYKCDTCHKQWWYESADA